MVWVVVAPGGTVPKATVPGVAFKLEVAEELVPVPDQPMASEASEALLLRVSAPEAFPAEAGLNIALTLAVAPAPRVAGVLMPEMVTPEPETATEEIVIEVEPEFLICTVCVDSEPTFTSPKLTEEGVTARFEDLLAAVALKETIIGESGALLLIIIFPEALPEAVAVKVVETLDVCPAARTSGSAGAFMLKPVPATEMPETERDLVPELVMVRVLVTLWPTVSEPKFTLDGVTSMETPVAAVPGFPAMPTHPEVISKPTTRNKVATVCRRLEIGRRRERKDAFTSAPSRMGASFITNAV